MSRVLLSTRRIVSTAICAASILFSTVTGYSETNWPKMLVSTPPTGERSLGAVGAPVIVLEYASATCPHCAIFHVQSWPHIKRDYVDTGKVRCHQGATARQSGHGGVHAGQMRAGGVVFRHLGRTFRGAKAVDGQRAAKRAMETHAA